MPRRRWHDLPDTVRNGVHHHAGHVEKVEPVAAGSIAEIAVILHTSGVAQFCKGITTANPNAWMYRNEARVNAALPSGIAPTLRWTVDRDGWFLLGFDHADGSHADVAPGSPDLPAVAATLARMSNALTPCPLAPVQPATARWAGRIAPEHVDGATLVHTDMTPRNFLVGERVAVVDWSTPCRGAPWLDTALMAVRLIRAGHTPEQAEAWATSVPAWQAARPVAVNAFVSAVADLHHQRHQQSPAPHRGELALSSRRWAEYRLRVVRQHA